MVSLKQKTVSGVKWQVTNKVLQKVISVGTFAVLARIIEPSAFGLFAMAFIAIDGLGIFKSLGLDSGIIQKKDCSESAKHTAFLIIQMTGIAMCFLSFLAAPIAAHFFNQPDLQSIIRILGILFVVNAFGKVSTSLLTKNMQFQEISLIQLFGSIVNSVIAILLAFLTKSVWSLVWAYLAKETISTILSYHFSGYRPQFRFDPKAAKELFGFGKFMVGMNIVWYVGANLNNIVIGKLLGSILLGFYALASNATDFINSHFTSLISHVMFPAYSHIQNDPEALKQAYLKKIKFISVFSIPFSIAIICLAEQLVLTLYGEKWTRIIPLIHILGFAQLIAPLAAGSHPVFLACGKPQYAFNLSLFSILLKIPLLIFFAARMGLLGVANVDVMMALLVGPISIFLARKVVHFEYREFTAGIAPSVFCGLFMAGVILGTKALLVVTPLALAPFHPVLFLLISGSLGLLTYIGIYYLIDKETTVEVKQMLLNKAD